MFKKVLLSLGLLLPISSFGSYKAPSKEVELLLDKLHEAAGLGNVLYNSELTQDELEKKSSKLLACLLIEEESNLRPEEDSVDYDDSITTLKKRGVLVLERIDEGTFNILKKISIIPDCKFSGAAAKCLKEWENGEDEAAAQCLKEWEEKERKMEEEGKRKGG